MSGLRSIVLLLVALAAQPAGAALIAYESFDYANVGGDLLGSGGGFGFSGNWQPGGFNAFTNTNYDIQADGLTFGPLLTSGRSAGTLAVDAMAGITRNLTAPLGLVDQTVYLSLLVRPEGVLNAGAFSGFFGLNFESATEPELFVGKPGGGATGQYVIEDRGGSGQVSSGVNAQVGETALLVVKAEFSATGNDTFTLFVNPTLGVEPLTGAVKSNSNVGSVVGLTIYSTGALRIDELRLGQTFADVTPAATAVPEPTSLALLLLGVGAIYFARRRPVTTPGAA